ncbi:MAG: pyrroline-5-carboxylate reductase [Chloroflexota bacterium]|nr:pyrroline-5-carboxylate reductase [Chloroflexota bacterium]
MKLSFIGGGTMAEAILNGILQAGLGNPSDIVVGEIVEARRKYLSDTYGIITTSDNIKAVQNADLTVLSIKPQDLESVSNTLKGQFKRNQSVVSIIAGASLTTLSQYIGHEEIIRVMPNTPAQIGYGMSVWTSAPAVEGANIDLTQSILATIGEEIYVNDEKYLDMATGLSASGPAYVFLIIEALIDAGVYVGLPRDMARLLALQTMYGSTKLAMETGSHPAQLKDMVVSPGGTTAEGVQVLEKCGVPAALIEAVNSSYLKSIALGKK